MYRNFILGHLMILGLVACNKPATPATATTGDGSAEGTKSEEGGETIVEPTMVGGAFLVCAKDETMPQRDYHIAAGCRLEDQDQTPFKIPDGVTSTLEVYDPLNSPISSSLIEKTSNGSWDWRVYVPAAAAWTNESLVKFVKNNADVGGASTSIALAEASSSEFVSITLGSIHDYALGTGVESCATESGNTRVDAGNMMIIPFFYSIPNGTDKFAITLKDYCIGGSGEQSFEVKVLKGTKSIFSKSYDASTKTVLIPGVVFEAGIYHLIIKVSAGGMLIPKIKFIANNADPLNVGKPVFQISDAPVDQGKTPTTFEKEESGNIAASSSTN